MRILFMGTPDIAAECLKALYSAGHLRFLFHLTKNLTTHLSHNLCAVLPQQCGKCLVSRFQAFLNRLTISSADMAQS